MSETVLMVRGDFLDADIWTDMASARGLRLPAWNLPPTPRLMRRWLKRMNLSWADYMALSGDRKMTDFPRRNPRWPCVAWIGLLLEWTERTESDSVGVNGDGSTHQTAEMACGVIAENNTLTTALQRESSGVGAGV